MKRKSQSTIGSGKRKRSKFSKSSNEVDETAKGEVLDPSVLREDLVLLGCVTAVRPSSVQVSLPGCMTGHVPLNHVSEKYTELLMGVQEDEQTPSLSEMVEVGATYPFKVMKVTFKEPSKKPYILLSMDPRDVNAELRPQSLYPNMVLHVSVLSIEDHGYIVDTGVLGTHGFIPFWSSPQGSLRVGQVIPTLLSKLPLEKRGNVVWLKRLEWEEERPEIKEDNIALSSILPGTKVTAYITEISKPFIYLKCMSFNACANMMSLGASQQNFNEATMVSGTVLYTDPISRLLYLQLGPTPSPPALPRYFHLRKYDLTKNVRFDYFYGHRIMFTIGKNAPYGFVKKGKMSDRHYLSPDTLAKNPVIPKARVVFLHYMDNLIELSMYEPTVNMEIIKPEAVQVGDIYEGTVVNHLSTGIFVSICPGLSGFVGCSYLSDVLVTMPEKLFPVGAQVKCRVISIQPDESDGSPFFYMSCKESLLGLDPDAMLLSYVQAQEGVSYKGVLVRRSEQFMVAAFFNGVKGIIHAEEIPEDSVYFVGQTVSCRVMQCSPESNRLKLSLRPSSKLTEAYQKPSKQLKKTSTGESKQTNFKKEDEDEKVDPRKKVKAMVVSSHKSQLNVILEGGKKGRIHVTEIGTTEEGTIPLHGFKQFQTVSVHVLGDYKSRAKRFLEFSHRRTRVFRECSMTFPPTAPMHADYEPGMKVMGYVKEVKSTSCTMWLSPTQIATLDYLHFSENPRELRKLHRRLKPGLALKATILEVMTLQKRTKCVYKLTLTRLDKHPVKPGRTTAGLVLEASPEKDLLLKLPHGHQGVAYLVDLLQDRLKGSVTRVLEKCKQLRYVQCHVLQVDRRTGNCLLSMGKSRIYEHSTPPGSHPEVPSASTLTHGQCLTGVVRLSAPDHLLVNIGRGKDGRVPLHQCLTRGCARCARMAGVVERCPAGAVVEVIAGEMGADGLVVLSLPELQGMNFSEESRLSVTEDINWEDV